MRHGEPGASPRSSEFADLRAHILLVLLALAVTPACVGNKAYRTQTPVLHETLQTRQFDPTQDDDSEWPFTMAFIEFDDRGEMFSRTQLERATGEIAAAKTVAAAQQSGEIRTRIAAAGLDLCEKRPESCVANPVVVVFVHGWKNISSSADYATRAFFPAAQSLSRPFNSLRTYRPRPIPAIIPCPFRERARGVPANEQRPFRGSCRLECRPRECRVALESGR